MRDYVLLHPNVKETTLFFFLFLVFVFFCCLSFFLWFYGSIPFIPRWGAAETKMYVLRKHEDNEQQQQQL